MDLLFDDEDESGDEDVVVVFHPADQVIHIVSCPELLVAVAITLLFEDIVVVARVLLVCDAINEVDCASTVIGYRDIRSVHL